MSDASKRQAREILASRRRAQKLKEEAEDAELRDAHARQREAQNVSALDRRPGTSSASIIQAARLRGD